MSAWQDIILLFVAVPLVWFAILFAVWVALWAGMLAAICIINLSKRKGE